MSSSSSSSNSTTTMLWTVILLTTLLFNSCFGWEGWYWNPEEVGDAHDDLVKICGSEDLRPCYKRIYEAARENFKGDPDEETMTKEFMEILAPMKQIIDRLEAKKEKQRLNRATRTTSYHIRFGRK
ncbi:hypothetical protein T4B_6079 [Trichinella pseudospiralis]|uniref:Uncharacterized protein n=1 Tax=Trichinella pseudospiralis TaxID=6337 RepID=A0A0V1J275_TRIPS|nr:hypothetical protein T4A_2758 [Trichinella pseudospiralis]KRZ29073.1 hypothetical protein T4B_6079 [Trichinella pseudospiralis]KRZ38222.1 hypothetical protein T4C_10165 [Trichinella pseudospiralis]